MESSLMNILSLKDFDARAFNLRSKHNGYKENQTTGLSWHFPCKFVRSAKQRVDPTVMNSFTMQERCGCLQECLLNSYRSRVSNTAFTPQGGVGPGLEPETRIASGLCSFSDSDSRRISDDNFQDSCRRNLLLLIVPNRC